MHFLCVGSGSGHKMSQKALKNTPKSRQKHINNWVKIPTQFLTRFCRDLDVFLSVFKLIFWSEQLPTHTKCISNFPYKTWWILMILCFATSEILIKSRFVRTFCCTACLHRFWRHFGSLLEHFWSTLEALLASKIEHVFVIGFWAVPEPEKSIKSSNLT